MGNRQEEIAMPKKRKTRAANATQMRWTFEPDVPVEDFFQGNSLDNVYGLHGAVESFVFWLERDRFLMWEAVVCKEQGIPLTPSHKNALSSLLNFNDEDEDRIFYIEELARYSQPWHVILNEIAPRLLMEPYRTSDIQYDVTCNGWNQIVIALRDHGGILCLPSGVQSAEAVVPSELRHKLWLQFCFDALSGLGQDQSLTLEDPKQQYRIQWFIDSLRERKDSVAFLGLTLESLGRQLILPEKDQPLFIELMKEKLGLRTVREPIAGVL